MSTLITIYIDDATEARMRVIAVELDRKVEDLAETAISEAALSYFRHDPSADPGAATLRATSRETLVEGARL